MVYLIRCEIQKLKLCDLGIATLCMTDGIASLTTTKDLSSECKMIYSTAK